MPDPENKKPSRPAESFVSKIVTDPANPPDLIRLAGYKGASSEANCTRLYLNPELNAYADIQEADIVHEEPVPTSADPLGAVVVWVKRDAKVNTRSTQQTAQAAAQPAGIATVVQTPLCAPSLFPLQCHSPLPVLCTIQRSIYAPCLTITPQCFPETPVTLQTTFPTTPATTAVGAQPQAAAFAAQAAAPQAGAQPLPTGIAHSIPCTLSPNVIFCGAPSPPPLFCITPPVSPNVIFCGAPSPPPLFCITPTEICTVRPSLQLYCTVQPTPSINPAQCPSAICTIVASPNCPTQATLTTIQPTTQPTTIATTQGQPAAFAAQAAAAPQTGAQALTYPSFAGLCPASQHVLCPTPSAVFQCPSQHPTFCTVAPSPHLGCTTVPSPDALHCTIQTQVPVCLPTVTAGQTGIQPFAAQAAAPQAAAAQAAAFYPTPTFHYTQWWVICNNPTLNTFVWMCLTRTPPQ